ncbi:dopamine receptor 1-like [Cloeon dipterum]|uniref:dopamine receptor 1-like n=1 Tax=Cloeon dipterum TaxID=197152 RepID=UPI003220498A
MDEGVQQILTEPLSLAIFAGIGIVMLCSVISNFVILVAIHVDKSMQSVGYMFIGSKTVVDLLTFVLVVPLAAVDDLLSYWPFSNALCDLWLASDITLVTVPIFTLLALSVDRYIHMKYATFYLRFVTRKVVILANVLAWILSTGVFLVPWTADLHRVGLRMDTQNRTLCIAEFPPSLSFTFSALSFVLPSACMLVVYRRIYSYSRRTTKEFELIFKSLQVNYPELDPKIPFQSECKATNTIGIIMTIFVVCWAPFFVAIMVRAIYPEYCCARWVFKAVHWLGYCNCVLCPLIYVSTNARFRAAFAKTLGCINEETYTRKVSVEFEKAKKRRRESKP